MHPLYGKTNKRLKISVAIVFSAMVILSFVGASQDILQDILKDIRQHGTECTFRARILEKTGDKSGLVVQKAPATDAREKRIYVFITRDTKIGYQVFGSTPTWKALSFNALREESYVLIHGLKIIDKEDDPETMYVEAKQIEPSE
jgi:hypothetical protein